MSKSGKRNKLDRLQSRQRARRTGEGGPEVPDTPEMREANARLKAQGREDFQGAKDSMTEEERAQWRPTHTDRGRKNVNAILDVIREEGGKTWN